MCHTHPEISRATSACPSKDESTCRQACEIFVRFLFKTIRQPFTVVLVVLAFTVPANLAHGSSRTIILNYICATYESARQVALERSWRSPGSMPDDCRMLFQQTIELRVAEILQIMEIIPVENSRWIEIGKVRLNSMRSGYSAGIAEKLLLF